MKLTVQSSRLSAACLILAIITSCLSSVAASGQERDWVAIFAFEGQTEAAVRSRLTSEYKMHLLLIDRVCDLEPSQSKKIESAAKLEVNRVFRDVARVRIKLSGMEINNNNAREAWTVVSPIATKIQNGLFKDGSLFQKVVHAALSEQQQHLYEDELEKIRRRRWKQITRLNVAEMERSMPLLDYQRVELLALLDQQKIPLTLARRSDGYAGYLKLTKIDEADLTELLDEEQMKVIQKFRQRFQRMGMMFQ